jgi:ATP-dependent protease ClpP protease subunit
MPKKIEIKGIITAAMPKGSWMQDYIDAGMITPVNFIIDAIKSSTEDIVLEIDSQGGSVFAGNAIINAMSDFRATGKAIDVEVGALAASMAAGIVLFAGGTVKAHANSKLMYHSAATIAEGGPEALEDVAGLLTKMNGDVIAELNRRGIPESTYAEWFNEGRMGWLTAQEAKALGIVSEIIGESAAKPKITRQFIAAATAAWPGFSVAALGDALDIEPEAEANPEPVAAVVAFDPLAKIAELEAAMVADAEAHLSQVEAIKAELAASRADLVTAKADHVKQIEAVKQEITAEFTAKIEGEKTAHAATAKALAELKEVHSRACPMGNLAGSGAADLEPEALGTPEEIRAKWQSAISEHGYPGACRLFPNLKSAMIK